MAGIPKEHGALYFDVLCRTQKKETIYSLIKATYYAKKRNLSIEETKVEIAKRLQNAYGLYKDNIRGYDNGYGSYQGSLDQFSSQYTIGHEMAIWKNSDLDLNDLALKVARDEITVTKYFDIILLNYFQPIQGKAINLLYSILKYMKKNNTNIIEKSSIEEALGVPTEDGATNGLFNIMGDTSYFTLEGSKLKLNDNISIDNLINKCNIKYIGEEGLQKAKIDLISSDAYLEYITSYNDSNDIENKTEEVTCQEDIKPYTEEDFKREVFISDEKYRDIINLLNKKKNIILTGAPGVGKTFMAKRLVYSIIGAKDNSKISMIQFHQSYSYEEFIEGYRPTNTGGFKLENGLFYNICKEAEKDSNTSYYLIIDEINRGNMSKIFGELLMLIEADKREVKLSLAYSKKEFSVPKNLYIIGLMNTADRSLAMIDYALRRRFSFINIEPAYGTSKFKNRFNEIFDNSYDDVMEMIEELNQDIKEDPSLGEGFMIGHSYFCVELENGRKATNDDIKRILYYDIKPLIEEYWYDERPMLDKWLRKIEEYIKR